MKEIRPLPQDIPAEQAVLGEILHANNLSYVTDLKPEDFYSLKHQVIFKAMQYLSEKGKPISLIILTDYLKNQNEIENIGGPAYLAELIEPSVSPELIPYYVDIIKKAAIKRFLRRKIDETNGKLNDEDVDSFVEEMKEFYGNLRLCPAFRLAPISLTELFNKDIPPVEYIVEGILQREGRTMISASPNIGKSLFLQNLAFAIASGQGMFLDKFKVQKGRVLYLDLEMGESALKQRFQQMCKDSKAEDLLLKFEPAFDLLDRNDRATLEKWLSDLKPDTLIIDPIGDAWSGDENNKQDVVKLTSYLNILKTKFKVAIIISHHWKKKTKDIKRGGEMASGSYKFNAWLDQHITLEGTIDSVTVSCEKSRNSARFDSFIVKLNKETFFFEFLADFEPKFTEQTLVDLFDSFNCPRVEITQLIQRAIERGICSRDTVRKLISESKVFQVDKSQKRHIIYKSQDCDKDSLFNAETSYGSYEKGQSV